MKHIICSFIAASCFIAATTSAQTNTFPSSGNTGIGTMSPAAKLDILPANGNALLIRPFGTAANNTGMLQFRELAANGTNYVAFRAPDALGSNLTFRLPTAYGSNGQVLGTTGSGVLTWITLTGGSGGASTSLNNLVATNVNQSLLPNTTNTRDLGSATRAWRNMYVYDSYYVRSWKVLDVSSVNGTFVGFTNNVTNTGTSNTVVGAFAMQNNTIGMGNSAVGHGALVSNQTGNYNSAFGLSTLVSNTTGSDNTAIGYDAMFTGNSNGNTAIGRSALRNANGNYNVAIGRQSGNAGGTSPSNQISLGYAAGSLGNNSNTTEIGNSSMIWIGGNAPWSLYSDARIKENIRDNVPGLSFISKLRPVTYNVNIHRQNAICGIDDPNEWEGKYDIEKIVQTGFIAQEVEAAAKACNYNFNGVTAPFGNAKLYSVQYSVFVMPLVKAVQELNDELIAIKSILSEEQLRRLNELSVNKITLKQNAPNPFNKSTTIQYEIPMQFEHAMLNLYSSQGVEVKSFPITKGGSGEITIEANALSAGIYSYTLIVDDAASDVKQMIVTK